MKYALIGLIALVLVGCERAPMNTVQLVNQVKTGTVLIENKLDTASGGIGTGFIIGENMIITNHHVIDGKGKITVVSSHDQVRYDAVVVHSDPVVDLAVLEIKEWEKFKAHEKVTILPLGDSEQSVPGSKVVIIGHPWGLHWTVSEGIVSAKDRRTGPNPKFVDQVDAKIYEGNSGGPVFNENGEVICVSELMLEGKGGSYGFCIPSNLVKKVINDFYTFKEVRWRAINVSVGLTDDGSSVVVNSIDAGGAADKAGIKVGDKILEIYTSDENSSGVKVTSPNALITELAALYGTVDTVKLLIDRNGKELVIDVKTNYKLSKDY
jgi:S1-C subfamily serine protease